MNSKINVAVSLLQDKLHNLVEPIAERTIWCWIRDIAMVRQNLLNGRSLSYLFLQVCRDVL